MRRQEFRDFEINFVGLDNSHHEFEFEIDEKFFSRFPESLIEKGKGNAFLEMDKSETMMHLHFHLVLSVELTCDVSLMKFDFPMEIHREIILKFGDDDFELSEEINVIHRESASFNVASFIFEFVTLEVPMKKLHPSIASEDRDEVIYSDTNDNKDQSEADKIDPRWEALKKLKDN